MGNGWYFGPLALYRHSLNLEPPSPHAKIFDLAFDALQREKTKPKDQRHLSSHPHLLIASPSQIDSGPMGWGRGLASGPRSYASRGLASGPMERGPRGLADGVLWAFD